MVPFPKGKGEPTPETEQIFLAGENLRVFEITNLIILQALHHGLEDYSLLLLSSKLNSLHKVLIIFS
jgi:hypothetical protein